MRSSFFWNVTRRRLVLIYRGFGKPTCPTFKGQADLNYLTPKDETDRFFRNVCK